MSKSVIEITTMIGCPNACVYCPQDNLRGSYIDKSKKIMNLQEFNFFLSQIDIPMDIHFSGYSEPFVVPDAVKMVEVSFDQGFDVGIATTLRGLKVEDFKLFLNKKFKFFTVHMPDQDGLMKFRIDDFFLKLLEESTKISGVDYLVMGQIDPRTAKIIGSEVASTKNLTDRGGNISLTEIPISIKDDFHKPINFSGPLYCEKRPLVDQFVLLPNGTITLCNADYGMKHVLGNLMENKMSEIICGKPFIQIKKAMLGENNIDLLCRTCRNAAPLSKKDIFLTKIKRTIGLQHKVSS